MLARDNGPAFLQLDLFSSFANSVSQEEEDHPHLIEEDELTPYESTPFMRKYLSLIEAELAEV